MVKEEIMLESNSIKQRLWRYCIEGNYAVVLLTARKQFRQQNSNGHRPDMDVHRPDMDVL
jgi:hypothetical protein